MYSYIRGHPLSFWPVRLTSHIHVGDLTSRISQYILVHRLTRGGLACRERLTNMRSMLTEEGHQRESQQDCDRRIYRRTGLMAEANIAGRDAPVKKRLLNVAGHCVMCWCEWEML